MNKKLMMSAILVSAAVVVALVVIRPWEMAGPHHGHDGQAGEEYYTCPMHPSVISDRPGACPVCGMALVKKIRAGALTMDTTSVLREVALSPAQRVAANISTVPAAHRRMVTAIAAVGVAAYAEPRRAIVAARFRGRIEKLFVASTGVVVPKGAPLFSLYSPDLISSQQEFLVAVRGTDDTGRFAAAARDRLVYQFGMTQAQVDSLRERGGVHSSMVFHSPLAGTVIKKEVQEGQFVDEGMELYELADLRRIWCVFEVYENDLRFVRTGMAVAITSDAYPGETFNGSVTLIEPTLNQETRTLRVRTELDNPGLRLRPNMFVKGRILARAVEVLAVPSSALLSTGSRTVVWVETGPGRFAPREIVAGMTADGYTEVVRGLHEGEMIAATGGFMLDSESQLNQPVGIHQGHGE
jgi:Cu(I)/Ag(I) efflux system membrane fusion protein